MQQFIRVLIRLLAAGLATCLSGYASAESAASFPSRPIRIVVPFPAGSGTDILARIISQEISADFKQPVIVDNRPGASTIIGTDLVAKSPADGYTLVMASNNHAINPALFAKLPFDPIADFTPVGQVAVLPFVLVVNPAVPAKNLQDVLALVRSKPREISYASTGNGTPPHVAGATLSSMANLEMLHVPYKGSADAITGVMSGTVPLMFANTLSVLSQVRAGKLRAIAVGSPQRIPQLPDVPTVAESGIADFDVSLWAGLLAPANTPKDVVAKLNAEVGKVLASAKVKEKFAHQGAESRSSTPEEFGKFIAAEVVRLGQIAKTTNMRVD